MNILDIAIAKQLAGGGGSGTVTSVSVEGGSGSHLTGSGNPIETSGTITIDVDEGYSIPSDNKQNAWDIKAADLKFEINSSTFVITAQLKDSNGNLIAHERTIDLPLESVVVNGAYDDQTKKVILTLQNGNTVEFSVADLVSGLQTELSASNKLNPDYIAYDASHRAVSDTEKDTWNAKQNAISDLETIRSGAAAGATAVQPATMSEALAAKQNSLNTAQLAAVNSGIDSDDVAQISTNQTNISLVQDAAEGLVDNGAKNLWNFANAEPVYKPNTNVVKTDTSVTITSTGNYATLSYPVTLKAGDYVWKTTITDFSVDLNNVFIAVSAAYNGSNLIKSQNISANGIYELSFSINSESTIYIIYALNPATTMPDAGNTLKSSENMICTEADWNVSKTYTPYAKPNYDLTRLESEDRASLAEVVDSGAKNLLSVPSTVTVSGITFVKDADDYISASPTDTDPRGRTYSECQYVTQLKKGTYYIVVDIKTPTTSNYSGVAVINTSNDRVVDIVASDLQASGRVKAQFTVTADGNYGVFSKTFDGSWRIMICTKAAFGVSQKFVPYRPDWDLVSYLAGAGGFKDNAHGGGIANADLNAISATSFAAYNNPTNLPTGVSGWCYVRTYVFDTNGSLQELFMIQTNPVSYFRIKSSGTWSAWIQTSNVS